MTTAKRQPRPARGMSDADFGELVDSAREGAQLLRGVAVPGARAWRVTPVGVPVAVPLDTLHPQQEPT